MLVKKGILINADIKKVWKTFCQLEKWPKWGAYITKTKWLSNDKWQVGSVFVQTIKGFMFAKGYNSKCRILKINPYKVVKWRGTRKLVYGTHSLKFQKIGTKTKISNIEYFRGPLAPIIFPFVKNRFESNFEQFNKGLKKEAEK